METPLVSIIIPCYNRELLIGDTLDSILNQSYTNWECIIVDDGSTDNTLNVLKYYTNITDKFRIIIRDRAPKGAQVCRNIGLENSSGKFLMFLDSDDILFSFALEKRIEFFMFHHELDFCVADGIRGEFPFRKTNQYYVISTFKTQNVLPQFLNFTIPWGVLNVIYKTDSLLKNEINWSLNLKSFQDIDFHVKLIGKGLRYDYCSHEPDCLWREHDHGNIGKEFLGNPTDVFIHKVALLKNILSNTQFNESELIPIYSHLIHVYLYSNVDVKISNDFFLDIYNNPFKSVFFKILFTLYRWTLINDVKKIKGMLNLFLAKLKLEKYLELRENNHFLIKPYILEI